LPNGDEQLVVQLEARIRDFERNMQKAERTGTGSFNALRKGASTASKGMEDDMVRSTSRIEQALSSFSGRIGGMGKAMMGGFVAGLSAAGLEQIIGRLHDTARGVAQIGEEAKRAGLSTKAFQELRFVAEQNRISVEALTDGMKELSLRADEWITTGGGSAAEAFRRLGYGADELKRKLADPSALLSDIIDRVGKLDRAAQIRIFDEIFGGTGGEQFVQLIDRGAESIRKTVQEARELGIVLDDEVIKKADEIDRKFNLIATTISTKLKSAVVSTVTELAKMSKDLNGSRDLALGLAGGRLMSKYAEIDQAKAKLEDLKFDLDQNPDDPIAAMNFEKQKELLADLKEEALAIRDIMDRMNGYDPDAGLDKSGDDAKEAKPQVDKLNTSLQSSNDAAALAAKGIKSYADAIRALRQEVPELAADLATLDAKSRIDQVYRAAMTKASTMGEVYQANQMRGDAMRALDMKTAAADPVKALSPYLGSGKSEQHLTGMQSQFQSNLAKMMAAAPQEVRDSTTINSGYRSVERQQQLWAEALQKYGSPEAARKWVAPPGNSQHNKGYAADMGFQTDEARNWFHANASKFGMSFPLGNEPWHMEDADARGKLDDEQSTKKVTALQDQAKAYEDIIKGAQDYVTTQQTEGQALQMTADRASAFRHEQELLRQAQSAGIELTNGQKQAISALAVEMANAEVKTKGLADSQQQAAQSVQLQKDMVSGAFTDIRSAFADGKITAQEWGSVVINMLSKVVDAFQNQVVNAMFSKGGFGNIFGSLLGGGGAFPAAPKVGLFAKGTNFAPGGPAIVGEKGPELINLPRGSQVVPNHRLNGALGGKGGGGGGRTSVDVGVSVDDNGKLQAYVKSISQQTAAETTASGIGQYHSRFGDYVEEYRQNPYNRG
jgi:LAS superfamily LD-carboxypeptidase LdcB